MKRLDNDKWLKIKDFFGAGSHVSAAPNRSVPFCVLATVDETGEARSTPISSLILGDDGQAFYFDEFSTKTSHNLERDGKVSVLLVNNNLLFWIKALVLGRFDSPPALRLRGTVGPKREGSSTEIKAFRRNIRPFKVFRGYQKLWGCMKKGREIRFESFEPVRCGSIRHLANI